MTAIVGLVHNNAVWLGGDSGTFTGMSRYTTPAGKLFRLGPCIIGLAGRAVDAQVLKYFFKPPALEGDIKTWAVTKFIPEVRKAFKEQGRQGMKDGVEGYDSLFLLGIRDRLFRVSTDLHVGDRDDAFQAVGCGEEFAYGSLFGSKGPPQKRLELALKAATYFSSGVHPPYTYLTTKGDK